MTLVATAISKHGIIHSAVPGLTSHPAHAGAGRRIFRLAFAHAILAVTGRYEVGPKPLDAWVARMEETYLKSNSHKPSIGGFAEAIRKALTSGDDSLHRRMVHLSGYEADGDRLHPVHYFIRNFRGMSPDGGYDKPRKEFQATEEFWTRDFLVEQTAETIRSGGAHIYLNGFPEARIAYLVLNQRMHDLYRQLWNSSERFRSPHSLEELATLLDVDMRLTLALLGHGPNRNGQNPGGGSVEIEMVPAPPGTLSLSAPAKKAAKRSVATRRRTAVD